MYIVRLSGVCESAVFKSLVFLEIHFQGKSRRLCMNACDMNFDGDQLVVELLLKQRKYTSPTKLRNEQEI